MADNAVEIENTIAAVAARKADWVGLGHAAKLELLQSIKRILTASVDEYAAGEARVRGFDLNAGLCPDIEGEQYLMGPASFANALDKLIHSYTALVNTGAPPPPVATRQVDDYTIARVFPNSVMDKVFGAGMYAELWTKDGASQGRRLRESEGGVVGILGAGNYSPPLDVLSKMFVENKVAIFKPHPNQVPLEPLLKRFLSPLSEAGFLGFVGPQDGQLLTSSPHITELLMTGGCATYDAIVWGGGAATAANKASGHKVCEKPFEAELGGVGPYVIVPGHYTEKELDHQAGHVAAAKATNSGFICASPQVIVVEKSWPQRERFLERVRHHLHRVSHTPAYYPGAAARHSAFREKYGDKVEAIAPGNDGVFNPQLPTLLITDVPPSADEKIIREEAFCPVLGETALDAPVGADGSPAAFLAAAADFCNNTLFGSLTCIVVIDDRTRAAHTAAFDEFLAKLEFGAIGVNTFTAMNIFLGVLPWGAYPKHSPEDVQSGIGKIQNLLLYDNPVKGIVYTPCVLPVHQSAGGGRLAGVRAANYCADPSWWKLIKVVSATLIGI